MSGTDAISHGCSPSGLAVHLSVCVQACLCRRQQPEKASGKQVSLNVHTALGGKVAAVPWRVHIDILLYCLHAAACLCTAPYISSCCACSALQRSVVFIHCWMDVRAHDLSCFLLSCSFLFIFPASCGITVAMILSIHALHQTSLQDIPNAYGLHQSTQQELCLYSPWALSSFSAAPALPYSACLP